jgi:hypothetical protein
LRQQLLIELLQDYHPFPLSHKLLKDFTGNPGLQMEEVIVEAFYRDDNQVGLTCGRFRDHPDSLPVSSQPVSELRELRYVHTVQLVALNVHGHNFIVNAMGMMARD